MRYMQLLAKTAGAKLEPLAIELFGAYPERIEDMADVVLEDTVMESSPGPIVGEEMKIDSKASVTNESMVDVEMDEVREKSPAHKSSPSQSMHSPLRSPSLLPPIDSPRRQSSEAQEKNNQDDSAMEVDEHAPLGQ